jgi:hypothetical protein
MSAIGSVIVILWPLASLKPVSVRGAPQEILERITVNQTLFVVVAYIRPPAGAILLVLTATTRQADSYLAGSRVIIPDE